MDGLKVRGKINRVMSQAGINVPNNSYLTIQYDIFSALQITNDFQADTYRTPASAECDSIQLLTTYNG